VLLSSVSIIAQTDDPVIMKIKGKEIKKSEFEYFYNKYNNDEMAGKITLDEYVKLFKNLKLRVAEAEAQYLDTTKAYRRELSDYRSQLAKSYLDSLEINEELVKKEYDRMKEEVEVSHILLTFPGVKNNVFKTFPSDTLAVWKKANQIRNRLLKGEKFEKLALEFSDDSVSKATENPGYLGWYTGLTLSPALEEVAYTTPVGKIGPLVHTPFGYHILKVLNRKENPGQINAAHILVNCPREADPAQVEAASEKIYTVYDQLLSGEDFSQLAKVNSDDTGTKSQGGDLGWFNPRSMVKEFQAVSSDLKKIGDFSMPFRTNFGFHIVKLLGRKPLEPYEDKKQEIENRLISGGYFVALYQPGIDKLKTEAGFVKNGAAYQMLRAAADSIFPTDSLFYDTFKNNSEVLFKAEGESYTVADFILFLRNNVRSPFSVSTEFLDDRLSSYESTTLQNAVDKALESKYPEFRNLMQEYHDGILMFEITNREVWEKASEDTTGLENYFKENKNQYTWEEPVFKGYIVWAKDTQTKKKMQKETSKMQPDEAVEYLYTNYKVGDVTHVKAEKGMFKKGDNPFVDELAFKSGVAEKTGEFQDFFLIGKILKAPESYKDVRGLVITNYQDYLETEWQKNLDEKYPVEINHELLITIK
jgi:peptidyl-prolyl cis-trans isomerase SurA